MSDLIQWPKAKYWTARWNPVIGCKPCSPACEHCYAAAWAKRFGQSFEPHSTKQEPPRKGVVFCGNMTDLFGEWMDVQQIWAYFSKLWHFTRDGSPRPNDATYLFCTKRTRILCESLRNYTLMPHSYFGFTAENQEWYDARCIDMALANAKPEANYWLSAEPLLGPIDLNRGSRGIPPFEWVVVGCESGPNRRPCNIEWVESIVEQCRSAGVPVFVKQLDIGGKCVTDINKFPAHLRMRQVPWAKEGGAK